MRRNGTDSSTPTAADSPDRPEPSASASPARYSRCIPTRARRSKKPASSRATRAWSNARRSASKAPAPTSSSPSVNPPERYENTTAAASHEAAAVLYTKRPQRLTPQNFTPARSSHGLAAADNLRNLVKAVAHKARRMNHRIINEFKTQGIFQPFHRHRIHIFVVPIGRVPL